MMTTKLKFSSWLPSNPEAVFERVILPDEIKDEIRDSLEEEPVLAVLPAGSYGRGIATPSSDLDVTVLTSFSTRSFLRLKNTCHEKSLAFREGSSKWVRMSDRGDERKEVPKSSIVEIKIRAFPTVLDGIFKEGAFRSFSSLEIFNQLCEISERGGVRGLQSQRFDLLIDELKSYPQWEDTLLLGGLYQFLTGIPPLLSPGAYEGWISSKYRTLGLLQGYQIITENRLSSELSPLSKINFKEWDISRDKAAFLGETIEGMRVPVGQALGIPCESLVQLRDEVQRKYKSLLAKKTAVPDEFVMALFNFVHQVAKGGSTTTSL